MSERDAKPVKVLFNETYTVSGADREKYEAGKVYELSPESAKHFMDRCDCELVDPEALKTATTPVAVGTGESRKGKKGKPAEAPPETPPADPPKTVDAPKADPKK